MTMSRESVQPYIDTFDSNRGVKSVGGQCRLTLIHLTMIEGSSDSRKCPNV